MPPFPAGKGAIHKTAANVIAGGQSRTKLFFSDERKRTEKALPRYQVPIFSASAWLIGWWARAWSSSASRRTASRAAMQPIPAAVTA